MKPVPSRPLEVERVAIKLGFQFVHQTGSHRRYKHSNGRSTTIAFHKARDIPQGTLRSIISDLGISVEQFNSMV